jgi:hypothetical protein
MIRNKIASWAHQEFNNSFTLSELEKNIRYGKDIFNRKTETTLTQVDISTSELYDTTMGRILQNYPEMISSDPIDNIPYSLNRDIIRRIRKITSRLSYELRRLLVR